MGIVEVEGMGEYAIEQRRGSRSKFGGIAEYGGAGTAQSGGINHCQQARRRFRFVASRDDDAQHIEQQELGPRGNRRRDSLAVQIGDEMGEAFGFMGHDLNLPPDYASADVANYPDIIKSGL